MAGAKSDAPPGAGTSSQHAEEGGAATPPGGGLTRRELFQGLGAAAVVGGMLGDGRRARAATNPGGPEVLGPGKVPLKLTVNGSERALAIEPRTTLLDALRLELDLTGAKPVCDRGACGACTVLVDGAPVVSCMMLALDAQGRTIATVEGLAQGDKLSPLQQAFVEHDALQCGFCTPGMLMACAAVLAQHPKPTAEDVRRGVAGNLCRCGTYPKVVSATLAAAGPSSPTGRTGQGG
ncbi:MAG TPA: (2Fe-2S)-binding protein [Polyangia bacterium]|jgi:aerobic-type carbon monoxide dehydrogenase small subunit (CoxS/CutS family)|nr:(2Fe-2S)-binding protein [Polyangia bacterium]